MLHSNGMYYYFSFKGMGYSLATQAGPIKVLQLVTYKRCYGQKTWNGRLHLICITFEPGVYTISGNPPVRIQIGG